MKVPSRSSLLITAKGKVDGRGKYDGKCLLLLLLVILCFLVVWRPTSWSTTFFFFSCCWWGWVPACARLCPPPPPAADGLVCARRTDEWDKFYSIRLSVSLYNSTSIDSSLPRFIFITRPPGAGRCSCGSCIDRANGNNNVISH
jgi:hypothetical protein